MAGSADHDVIAKGNETARIQEPHTVILHLILERVEEAFVEVR